jgi:iron complex transport system substrate-binding protein
VASALVVPALLVSACSGDSPDDASSSAAITVTDQRGKAVTLDGPANRIASAVIPAPTIIAAVDGSWDRIVGINASLLQANQQGIISKIFPASTSTAVVADRSFVPNMEQILSLEPDLVVQWGDMGDEVIDPIEQAGIPTVGLEYGTQDDLETWIALFGTAIGKADRATAIIDGMHAEADAVREQVAALGAASPRGLSLSYTDESLSVSTGADYAQDVFDMASVTNVAKDGQVSNGVVSAEQIIAWDPEVIFLSAFDTATPQDVYDDPRLADIAAVRDHRVYRSPLGVYRWQVPCAESPLYWNWVAALAYPGQYEVDLPAMMRQQITYLYSYDITDDDIALILRTDINHRSASYDAVSR